MMTVITSNLKTYPMTVVIATLGGDSLKGTIEALNRGSIVPDEILVCIPANEAHRVQKPPFQNVKMLVTECRGQVAQRTIGFQQAQQPMVLQLDDDIILNEDSLQILASSLCILGQGSALAPVYYEAATGRCIHELAVGIKGFLKSLYYYVVCGSPWGAKRMGAVTSAGLSFGVDGNHCSKKPFAAQWLPGGCVLCFKDDLITEEFFPYSGKAYCEDLIHSFLRTKRGIRLWVIPSAKCSIDAPISELGTPFISAQFQARRYFVKLSGGSVWRLAICEFFSALKQALSSKN